MVKLSFILLLLLSQSVICNILKQNAKFYYEKAMYAEALYFAEKYAEDSASVKPQILFMIGKIHFHLGDYDIAYQKLINAKEKILKGENSIEVKDFLGLDYFIVMCLFQMNKIDKRLILNIENSQDTLLAEARYVVALFMDQYFFTDLKKLNYQYSDSVVISMYEKVLEIYPEHKKSKERIEVITDGKR